MMELFSRFSIRAIASGLCLFAPAFFVTTSIAASVAPTPHISVNEDSGAWRRRNPFIEDNKTGGGTAAAKNISRKPGAGIRKHILDDDIHVQGIMQADRKFHALINGRTVKAGDRIGGVTIKEINRYSVVVLNEQKEKIIYDIYQGRIDRGKK